jgi:hypothetical protein
VKGNQWGIYHDVDSPYYDATHAAVAKHTSADAEASRWLQAAEAIRGQSRVAGGAVLALDSPCVLAQKTTMPSPMGTERFAGLAATTPIREARILRLRSSCTPTCLHVAVFSEVRLLRGLRSALR